MTILKNVIFFFVNTFWYITVVAGPLLRGVVSFVSFVALMMFMFGGGSGWNAFLWFALLTFLTVFPTAYKPKNFSR